MHSADSEPSTFTAHVRPSFVYLDTNPGPPASLWIVRCNPVPTRIAQQRVPASPSHRPPCVSCRARSSHCARSPLRACASSSTKTTSASSRDGSRALVSSPWLRCWGSASANNSWNTIRRRILPGPLRLWARVPKPAAEVCVLRPLVSEVADDRHDDDQDLPPERVQGGRNLR